MTHTRTHVVLCLTAMIVLAAAAPLFAQDKPALQVDKEKKTIRIPCKVAPRKLPNLSEVYPIEVIASFAAPKGKKAHETVVTFEVLPSEIHKALEGLGLTAGKPAKGQDSEAQGPEVGVSLEIPGPEKTTKKVPIEKTLVDRKTGKTMPKVKWRFTGSVMLQLDPNKPEKTYGADASGTLIAIFPVTDETVIQTSLTMKEEPFIKMDTNKDVLPAEGTDVTLLIEVK